MTKKYMIHTRTCQFDHTNLAKVVPSISSVSATRTQKNMEATT
uniref:Uncharacterized protein n=1 Tax=Arundo donax TaxID=35708 RepID=A0A0A9B7I0_ARUDO